MGLFDSLDIFSQYSTFNFETDEVGIDLKSFWKWLEADEEERSRMEMTMDEKGKLAFREKAYELGFFKK